MILLFRCARCGMLPDARYEMTPLGLDRYFMQCPRCNNQTVPQVDPETAKRVWNEANRPPVCIRSTYKRRAWRCSRTTCPYHVEANVPTQSWSDTLDMLGQPGCLWREE